MSALLGAALMIAGGLPALEARRRCSDSGFAPCPADSASSGLLHWAPMSRAPITSEGPNASGRSGFGGLCDEAGLADEISPIMLGTMTQESWFYTHLSNDEPRCPLIATHKWPRTIMCGPCGSWPKELALTNSCNYLQPPGGATVVRPPAGELSIALLNACQRRICRTVHPTYLVH